MSSFIFPVLTEFESKLPLHLLGVGSKYSQEHVTRTKGFPNLQIIHCRRGMGELLIDDKSFIINENQGILLFPNVPHEYYAVNNQWDVDWVVIGGFAAEQIFTNAGITMSKVYTAADSKHILLITEKLYEMAKSYNVERSLECSKMLYNLVIDVLTYCSSENADYLPNHYSRLKPVFDHIEKNYNKLITLEDLAEVSGLTPQYLCSIFKKASGIRIFEYINNVRIKNSKEMLIQFKDLPIKAVAVKCGYDDVSYFCSIFKKLEKMTPGEFKKMYV